MRVFLIGCVSLLSACSVAPKPAITLSRAIQGVEQDFAAYHAVDTAGAASWGSAQEAAFDSAVISQQCRQKNADPILAFIAAPVQLSLSGTFSQSGSFSVTASGLTPAFGFGASAARSQTDEMMLAVQFVPLGSLPDAEMARESAYAQPVMAQNDKNRLIEGDRVLANRDALAAHVRLLIAAYKESLCPKVILSDRPLVGVRAP